MSRPVSRHFSLGTNRPSVGLGPVSGFLCFLFLSLDYLLSGTRLCPWKHSMYVLMFSWAVYLIFSKCPWKCASCGEVTWRACSGWVLSLGLDGTCISFFLFFLCFELLRFISLSLCKWVHGPQDHCGHQRIAGGSQFSPSTVREPAFLYWSWAQGEACSADPTSSFYRRSWRVVQAQACPQCGFHLSIKVKCSLPETAYFY